MNNTLINNTNFKTQLLQDNGNGKWKAKSSDAASFLKELGYSSGSDTTDYSTAEVANIGLLKASAKNGATGKVEPTSDNSDYLALKTDCQIDISLNDKITNSYSSFTKDNQPLKIKDEVAKIITSVNDLTLNADSGFQINQPLANFKIKIKDAKKQIQWDALITSLNLTVNLNWYNSQTSSAPLTGNFDNIPNFYLEISFANVLVTPRFDCGAPIPK